MNPLNTVKNSIVTGVVLSVVIAGVLSSSVSFNHLAFTRWLHIVAGVMWIGLLYYFNVVQIPGLAAAAADQGGPGGAGISKYIAPRALLWFRWAAVVTWLTGAAYLLHTGVLVKAFTLAEGSRVIGVGAWLGSIMLFNVWVLIWPNQKKVLGIVSATDAEKATARRIAMLASRTNFVLSIPMLMCMGGQNHGLPF
jgi:uncharacterized membrane protein